MRRMEKRRRVRAARIGRLVESFLISLATSLLAALVIKLIGL